MCTPPPMPSLARVLRDAFADGSPSPSSPLQFQIELRSVAGQKALRCALLAMVPQIDELSKRRREWMKQQQQQAPKITTGQLEEQANNAVEVDQANRFAAPVSQLLDMSPEMRPASPWSDCFGTTSGGGNMYNPATAKATSSPYGRSHLNGMLDEDDDASVRVRYDAAQSRTRQGLEGGARKDESVDAQEAAEQAHDSDRTLDLGERLRLWKAGQKAEEDSKKNATALVAASMQAFQRGRAREPGLTGIESWRELRPQAKPVGRLSIEQVERFLLPPQTESVGRLSIEHVERFLLA